MAPSAGAGANPGHPPEAARDALARQAQNAAPVAGGTPDPGRKRDSAAAGPDAPAQPPGLRPWLHAPPAANGASAPARQHANPSAQGSGSASTNGVPAAGQAAAAQHAAHGAPAVVEGPGVRPGGSAASAPLAPPRRWDGGSGGGAGLGGNPGAYVASPAAKVASWGRAALAANGAGPHSANPVDPISGAPLDERLSNGSSLHSLESGELA